MQLADVSELEAVRFGLSEARVRWPRFAFRLSPSEDITSRQFPHRRPFRGAARS